MATAIQKTDERQGWTSASNAAADRRCEGRHNAQRGIPEAPPTEDSLFGTQIHDALFDDDLSKLSAEQLSIYESCVEIRDQVAAQFFGPDYEKIKVFKEHRVWCDVIAKPGDKSPKPARYRHSAKIDWLARYADKALIIEYKTLPGDVPSSPANEQIRDQVVMASGNLVVKNIGAAVVQPLVTHTPEVVTYSADTIARSEREMYARVRASNNPDAKRTPNPTSCQFCRAKTSCVEYHKWATAMLPDTGTIVATPVTQWSPEMRAHYCHMRGVARKWLDVCDAEMKRILEEDKTAIPGWTLEPGKVRRPVTDPQELFNRFCAAGKAWASNEPNPNEVLLALFMSCVKIGKGDLDGAVRKITGLKGKALAAAIDVMLSGITEDKQDSPSLSKVV